MTFRSLIIVPAMGTIILCANMAVAQSYPLKPIRIVTGEPGGGAEFAARLVAREITGGLGQPVIVESRGGASGVIAIETVARALPDGYTTLLYSNVVWTLPFIRAVPYDPIKDFSPITLLGKTPAILAVHPSLAVKSTQALIALSKAKPGELNYAAASSGSASHLAAELFKSMASVNIARIPYKGTGPALNAVIGGQVPLMFPIASAALPHIKAGRLRALAVTTLEPSALAPGLVTIASAGLPGFEVASLQGVWAPAKVPVAIVARLNQEIVRALNRTDVKQTLFKSGLDTVGNTPGQFSAYIKSDMAVMGKLVKDAGITAD